MAIVIDGAFAVGALMSILSPAFSAAFEVVGPKVAIFVSPCSNSGKFLSNDSIPLGLKKTSKSYLTAA